MTIPYLAEIAKAHEQLQEQRPPEYSQVLQGESSTASFGGESSSTITPTPSSSRTSPPQNQSIPPPCQPSLPSVAPTLSTVSTVDGGENYNRGDHDLPPAYSLLDENVEHSIEMGNPPQDGWRSDVKGVKAESDTGGEVGEQSADGDSLHRLPSQATISSTDNTLPLAVICIALLT